MATPITFIHEGTNATGFLANVPFSTSHFRIEANADTDNRVSFAHGYWIVHASASINIEGIGTLQIATPTRTFVNNSVAKVGFSRAGGGGHDLFNGPADSAFGAWDLLSEIGPITGSGTLLQWAFEPVIQTDQGVLYFDPREVSATFTAIPEPSAFALATIAMVWALVLRRKL